MALLEHSTNWQDERVQQVVCILSMQCSGVACKGGSAAAQSLLDGAEATVCQSLPC